MTTSHDSGRRPQSGVSPIRNPQSEIRNGVLEALQSRFREVLPKADFCSLRFLDERSEVLSVRQDVPQPITQSQDVGAMITVIHAGGMGYAATSDLTVAGLGRAVEQAMEWARRSVGRLVLDVGKLTPPSPVGEYFGPERIAWNSMPLKEKFELLLAQCRRLKINERIVDWQAALGHTEAHSIYLTSAGGQVEQRFHYAGPFLRATANAGAQTQNRTLGGLAHFRQGGLEVLDQVGFRTAAPQIAEEAIQLLEAPNCPSETMDLLLAPDQMILQIHESVGHPLELDRILGDERNYAGTSFVTPEMFGSYRYGSNLLNISYDPSRPDEMASYRYDDDGTEARKTLLIEKGILQRGLGGMTSQTRCNIAGVANSRASTWSRPAIDRMANLNLEPGSSSLAEMIASIKRGIYMKTNCSWSIDDSRNKFQFGCEWGQLIEDGQLTTVVKNPNYRGISATFWRNLKMAGDESTLDVMGTPNCGKGEPNQVIHVGHASPACVFADVAVFGGE